MREEGTGRWWRFDDGEVRLMDKGPLGEHGDHGVQSTAAAEKRVRAFFLSRLFAATSACTKSLAAIPCVAR